MITRTVLGRSCVVLALALLCAGCDSGSSTSDSSADEKEVTTDDPVKMAKEIDATIDQDLKTSKIDARQWLAAQNHATWEAEKKDIVKYCDDVMAAGAVGVWVTDPQVLEKVEFIDRVFVELPKDPAKRKAVIAASNKASANYQEGDTDLGQKYLNFSWD